MKQLHTLLMTVLLSAAASAAEPGPVPAGTEAPRTILGVAFTPAQWGALTLEGERVVGPRLTVGLGLRAGIARSGGRREYEEQPGPNVEGDQAVYLLGAGPQARFFLTGTAPEGLWLSPRLEVARAWASYENRNDGGWDASTEHRQWSLGGTALLGYSTIVGRGLAIQAGVGVEARYESNRYTDHHLPPTDSGFVAFESRSRIRSWSVNERLALSLGWAF